MKIIEVTKLDQLAKGDTIIITGDALVNDVIKIPMVKVSEFDGIEIIINKRLNKFFNLGMYLKEQSWVKKLHKIEFN